MVLDVTPAALLEVCNALEPVAVVLVLNAGVLVGLLAVVDCEVSPGGLSFNAKELPVFMVAASNSPPIIALATRDPVFLVLICNTCFLLNATRCYRAGRIELFR